MEAALGAPVHADFRRLLALARPHTRRLLIAFVAGLVTTGTIIAIPLVTKTAIDDAIRGDDRGQLVALAFTGLGIGALRAFSNYVRRNLSGMVSVDIEAELRGRLFAHLQGLPISFHDRSESGQLLARATGDLNAIRMFLGYALVFFAYLVLTVAGVVVLLFVLSPWLALVTVGLVGPFIGAALLFNRRMEQIAQDSREATGAVTSVVEEAAGGVRVLKSFGREARAVEQLDHAAAHLRDVNLRGVRIKGFYIPALSFIPNFALIAILAVGGMQVIDGALSVGTLIAFNQSLAQLVFPLRNVGFILTSSQQAAAASVRVFEIFDTQPDITDPPGAATLGSVDGHVTFERVTFVYPGTTAKALDDISFEVPAGQTVAIVGLSGSGKSTIAALVPRFADPTEGRVLVDGVDVRSVTVRSLRRNIGVVFDEPILFSSTIRENIAFGQPDASRDDIERAARAAGADAFVAELPDGYDTRVGESGLTLSGGQRQRLALARALLFRPRILILDDPLSSVDVETEAEIEANLRDLLHGRTTFLIAHRASTISMADRVLLVDGGRIVADGTHRELLASMPAYRRVLAADLEIDELVLLEEPAKR